VEDFHLEGLPGDRTDSVGSNLSAGTPKHTTFFDKFVFFLLDRRGGEREGFIEKNVFFFFFVEYAFFLLPLLVQLFAFDFSLRDTTCLGDFLHGYCTIVFNKFE
jgi:hypothetical protein